jgi:hypothetical protein
MWDSMAESKSTMARIERLEGAFVQITDLLVLQGERLDGLREEMHGLRGETHGLRGETHAMREALTDRLEAVTDRLDRLIAVTTREPVLRHPRVQKARDVASRGKLRRIAPPSAPPKTKP